MKAILVLVSMLMIASCGAEETPNNIEHQLSARFAASGISSDAAIHDFFNKVKGYIGSGDSEKLAKLIAYPIKVRGLDGKEILQINDSNDFVTHYDAIITERVKHTVICSTFDELSATYKGVMIGDGAVWFTNVKYNDEDPWVMLITRINNSHKDKQLWFKSAECK
ncbi:MULTISPECIES: hypothetical protein [Shewanella]|uniref:hypothetical protein n=1 Tax=Shewanella TaxID=22 RepID=UPI000687E6B9|nr:MULTISPECIES: hypothetical protein [Shewanella]MDV5247156.1 hypothetical protein [Shewanella xiamenensis]PWH01159.1 hypothetical protein DIY08_19310 [Shewanella xiamenensis]